MSKSTKHVAIIDWLINGETGLSSKTLAAWIVGMPIDDIPNHPWDADDCRRCALLIQRLPEVDWHRITETYPEWERWVPVIQGLLDSGLNLHRHVYWQELRKSKIGASQ